MQAEATNAHLDTARLKAFATRRLLADSDSKKSDTLILRRSHVFDSSFEVRTREEAVSAQ